MKKFEAVIQVVKMFLPRSEKLKISLSNLLLGIVLTIGCQVLIQGDYLRFSVGHTEFIDNGLPSNYLYLMDEARKHIKQTRDFEFKVRQVAEKLEVAPEWLMAVMYSESRFDAGVSNFKGSGAVGLIQWMPVTAKELGTTVDELKKMPATLQMDYVYAYLNKVKNRYGSYNSLTDLYLAILYPRSLEGNDMCYTLYAKPSVAYKQNSGLDHNKDGRVTVSDIDQRMMKKFTSAYQLDKNGNQRNQQTAMLGW